MRRYSDFVFRFAGVISIVGTLLGLVGAYYTMKLYKNLRTDFEELLPTSSRSVTDLNEVAHRVESFDSLAVLIFSKDVEASKQFVIDLTKELEKAPKTLVSSYEYKISSELKFFKDREALYMNVSDLNRIRNFVQKKIEYEQELFNPLNIFSEEKIPEPKLDISSMRHRYTYRIGAFQRFPGGYFATPDGTIRVVLIYSPGKAGNVGNAIRLTHWVSNLVAKLDPATYSPGLTVRYAGGIEDVLEEHQSLIADLVKSTILVSVAVTFAMLLFFRDWVSTLCLVISLFMGTFWTFGLSYFLVGYLNANSAFLGSIVIGNGINFGIIALARFLEARREGLHVRESIGLSTLMTSRATLTAALAAGLSYGSLMSTSFRGFNQFGVIGLTGMVFCWISAYTLMPAYLGLFGRTRLFRKPPKAQRQHILKVISLAIRKYPGLIWAISAVLAMISLALVLTADKSDILETNLSKLRSSYSMEKGSGYLSRYLDDIFEKFLSPVVVLPNSRSNSLKIAEALKREKAMTSNQDLIASVDTIDDLIPDHQAAKIQILKDIRKMLKPSIMALLTPKDKKLAGELLTPQALRPISLKDLPPAILRKFTEKDGSIGKMVLVAPPLRSEDWKGESLIRFVDVIRKAADQVEPQTPVAGTLVTNADIIQSVSADGPKATIFAFLAVFLLVVFLFRDSRTIGICLFALILGIIWLAGIILGSSIKINFFNFIALPITFGIGVDYGVNVFQRYQQEGNLNILRVIRQTGGAVLLSSFTTTMGYFSLLLASNRGLYSFGRLAVSGEITCVTAAVISLPAYLLIRERSKERKMVRETHEEKRAA